MATHPGPLSPDLRAAVERIDGSPPVVLLEASRHRISHWSLEEWAVLQCCDGTRSPQQLLKHLANRDVILTPNDLRLLLRRARAAGLFSKRPQPAGSRPPPPASAWLMPETLPEARYRCLCCGESCSAGYDIGPLPSSTKLPDGQTVLLPTAAGLRPHLPHHNGRCTQLDLKTGLCHLHATLGPESKPIACREFPLLVLNTPDGLRAALQWECTRLHTLLQSGPPLASLLSPELLAAAELIPEELVVGDGRLLSFSRYRRLERFLLDACQRNSLDAVAFSLLPLIRSLASRETESDWTEIISATQASLVHRTDMFLVEYSGLIASLFRAGQALEESAQLLHPTDRRRVYRRFCQRILESWMKGGPIPLGPLTRPPLFQAWLRNRLFGLTLVRARCLSEGALELTLRWAMLRTGLLLPLEFVPEGTTGDDENRRIVALEHGLRAERLHAVLSRRKGT